MATSASGVAFFLFIVLIGPIFFGIRYLFRLRTGYYDDMRTEGNLDKELALRSVVHTPFGVAGAESTDGDVISGRNGEERGQVTFLELLFSLIGYAIGIGNVWRFPYLVGKYGGFAFIIAYLVCLFLCALPLFLMELGVGQHVQKSVVATFNTIRPRWWPLGLTQILGPTIVVVSYYNVLLSYSLLYMCRSCEEPLPWTGDAQAFWQKDVLNAPDKSEGTDLGRVSATLTACLFAIYVVIFGAVGFGKEVLAQFTWVTVILPVILVTILLIKAVSLEGASAGIDYYINKLEWTQLANGELWAAAAGQILFSLSPGTGCAITLTSHSKKNTDVYVVALVVAFCNSGFSLFSGFAIFSVLGNLAYSVGQPVSVIAESSGIGLAFIAIAEGMTHFGEMGNVMSVLFFSMLLMLGFDSSFAWIESGISVLDDFLKKKEIFVPRLTLTALLCLFLFLIGIPYCTEQGGFLLDVIDHFIGSYLILYSCAAEGIAFVLDFGFDRLAYSIKKATEENSGTIGGRTLFPVYFWQGTMRFTAPLLAGGLLLTNISLDCISKYGDGRISDYILTIGWTFFILMVLLSLSNILDRRPGTLGEVPRHFVGLAAAEKDNELSAAQ